ncbi:F-box protein At5g03100-like [Nicotiana tomentosiformis]|uniref:F-box protein At5g03100-like n=1 Tax=Nicotiana tomentosiformis TaxID=4098 RepID=UPI00388CE0E4
MEEIGDGEDRISELPIQIIHDILRRIRRQYELKEEARTCILSKTWSSIWRSRPEVIINQSIHNSFMNSTEKFVKFVDDSLRSHVEQNLRIEILRLINLRLPELASHIDRWLNLAIKHNVRSLEIHPTSNFSYCIPDAIYAAKTLTELSLNKCNFEIDNNNSTTNKLQRIISTCPFIRDLKIGHCTEMWTQVRTIIF